MKIRKLIDIDRETKKKLSIIAAYEETNLKHLIERILDDYVIIQAQNNKFTQIRR